VSRVARAFAALVVGAAVTFGLAAGSVVIHRPVPTAVGNMCDPAGDNPSGLCFERLPAGGWPFSFVYDDPGTSIVGRLGPEDDVRPGRFLLDAAIFAILPAFGAVVLRMRWRRPST
jgi:hypothetical protein